VPTIGLNPAATVDRLDDGIVDVVIAKPSIDPLPQLITASTNEEKDLIAELKKLIEKNRKESTNALPNWTAQRTRS
jgi:hypothetical protein